MCFNAYVRWAFSRSVLDRRRGKISAFVIFLLFIFYFSIASGDSVNSNQDVTLRLTRAYPPIGRLFRADVPSLFRRDLHRQPKSEIQVEAINSAAYKNKKDVLNFLLADKTTESDSSKNSRIKRSETVVSHNGKLQVNHHEEKKNRDKKKKKKNVTQSTVRRKRVRRSEPEKLDKVQQYNTTNTSKIGKNVTSSEDILQIKKVFAKKSFQKKVEDLFNVDADSSKIPAEEIEKSKILRKQLLSLYVNGYHRLAPSRIPQNHSTAEVAQRKKTSENENLKLQKYLRMFLDVPLGEDDDLLNQLEQLSEEELVGSQEMSTDTVQEGRTGRRRLRRIALPILLVLKLKMFILAFFSFGIVSLIAFKGLWAGITALGVVSALGLKSLINNPSKIMYEIRTPHRYHYPPFSELQYHHGPPIYDYWNRREDSYKPSGGWRNNDRIDEIPDEWGAPTDGNGYSTLGHTEVIEEVKNETALEKSKEGSPGVPCNSN